MFQRQNIIVVVNIDSQHINHKQLQYLDQDEHEQSELFRLHGLALLLLLQFKLAFILIYTYDSSFMHAFGRLIELENKYVSGTHYEHKIDDRSIMQTSTNYVENSKPASCLILIYVKYDLFFILFHYLLICDETR